MKPLLTAGTPPMPGRTAFTLVETLLVLVVLALLVGMLMALRARARRTDLQRRSAVQLRGIHSGCVLYAGGNNVYYPGLQTDGAVEWEHPLRTNHSPHPLSTAWRFRLMLENHYFDSEHAISPVEADVKVAWTTGAVTTANFSYAMLDVSPEEGPRRADWRDYGWTEPANISPMLSDRLTSGELGQLNTYRSIHAHAGSDRPWRGLVAWQDNHVSWENKPAMDKTRYRLGPEHAADDLFTMLDSSDAYLVYHGH